ncbi:MAG: TonB-dependent receptor [Pseudomonadota bacterium]
MRKFSYLLCCASGIALGFPADSAFAQAAEEAPSYGSGEIIVTAQKREQSINDVGLTIQAASAESLADRGIRDVGDLSKLVPGFIATASTFSTPIYTLRGIGLYDSTIGAAPAVAIYTDEIARNYPIMSDALNLDIERVEVLKGPQGTLFGQSSTGGAINYIVAKPTDTFQMGFDGSYERFNRADVSGFVSGPLSDTLKGRLAVRGITGGAWQYNLAKASLNNPNEELGDERKIMGRLSLDWTPSDRIRIQTTVTGARDRSDLQAPRYEGSFYNIYSAAALATANASPATANPYGVVDELLYSQLTTPGNPGYLSTFLTFQNSAVTRMNGTNSINAFPQPWAQFDWAQSARFVLGTPVVNNARAASWSPGFMRGNRDWYYQGTLRADIDLTDDITLTSITSYQKKKVDHTVELDGTGSSSYDILSFGKVEAFNQELRLSGKTDRLNWIIGANYDHVKTEDNNAYILYSFLGADPFGWAATGVGPVQDTLNLFSNTLKTYAFFGNGEFNITDNLSISGGIRYTNNELSASYAYVDPPADDTFSNWYGANSVFMAICGCTIQPGESFVLGDGRPGYPAFTPIIDPLKDSLTEDNWSWRVGLDYKFDNGGLIYATVSQGYKAGVFSNIGASVISQYVPARQEKLVSYEAGFKMPFANRRVRLNASAFYYDYKDKQVRAKILDNIWGLLERLVNVPKSEVYGVEGSFFAEPIDGLNFSASATWMKSKVTETFTQLVVGTTSFPVFNNMGFTGEFKGSELPYTPEFSANADVQYEWQMGDLKPFVGGTFVYQGKSNATFENDVLRADYFEIPAYETVDLRAGVSGNDGKWKVSVYGRNVLNKFYITSPTYYGDARWSMSGRPAVYGASFSVRY